MAATFKIGDHVSWNSEAGRVAGRILRVHTKDVNYKGYVHHWSVFPHKGTALKRGTRSFYILIKINVKARR